MHITIAALYGLSVWLPFILYTAATGGSVLLAVLLGPLIVSGAALGLLALDAFIDWLTTPAPGDGDEPRQEPAE